MVVNGHARKRSVTSAGSSYNGVLVQCRIVGGEELIAGPPANLKDGQKVAVYKFEARSSGEGIKHE